jgi:hypothetical protein
VIGVPNKRLRTRATPGTVHTAVAVEARHEVIWRAFSALSHAAVRIGETVQPASGVLSAHSRSQIRQAGSAACVGWKPLLALAAAQRAVYCGLGTMPPDIMSYWRSSYGSRLLASRHTSTARRCPIQRLACLLHLLG